MTGMILVSVPVYLASAWPENHTGKIVTCETLWSFILAGISLIPPWIAILLCSIVLLFFIEFHFPIFRKNKQNRR